MSTFPDEIEMPDAAQYSARFPMALAYAAVRHAAQTRKDERHLPYISHPMAVATLVWHYGLGADWSIEDLEDPAIGALLHDVAEDGGGQAALDEIDALFGPAVREIVDAASDCLVEDPADKPVWYERKRAHIARVGRIARREDGVADEFVSSACLVIACDKLHNLTGTAAGVQQHGEAYLRRFKPTPDRTRWYYRAMYEALQPALPPDLQAEIERQLAALGA